MEDFYNGKEKRVFDCGQQSQGLHQKQEDDDLSDALAAISDRVYCMLDKAAERTKANRRSTVKPQDL
jgi:hypothetical protein